MVILPNSIINFEELPENLIEIGEISAAYNSREYYRYKTEKQETFPAFLIDLLQTY
jgi:hypothetical protein